MDFKRIGAPSSVPTLHFLSRGFPGFQHIHSHKILASDGLKIKKPTHAHINLINPYFRTYSQLVDRAENQKVINHLFSGSGYER
jgi:hypothetical protein